MGGCYSTVFSVVLESFVGFVVGFVCFKLFFSWVSVFFLSVGDWFVVLAGGDVIFGLGGGYE